MKRRSAAILLSIFIVSVSFNQVIEFGHSLLHSFENPFHYHKARKSADYKAHSVVDHHFARMQFAHEMDEHQPPDNFIALAFVFFEPIDELQFQRKGDMETHFTSVTEHLYFVSTCPPTPPPPATIQA